MSRSVVEKAICNECGVDARDNTFFCYNCGSRLAYPELSDEGISPPLDDDAAFIPGGNDTTRSEARLGESISPEAKEALNDLVNRISIEPPTMDGAIELAAAKRRKARGVKKKAREYVWEPVEDRPGPLMLMIVIMITVLAVLAVVVAVVWK